jgi:hypothetical protein
MEKRQVAEVIVTVGQPPDKGLVLEVRYKTGNPDVKKFGNWDETAYNACLHATRADMESFELAFILSPDETCWTEVDIPPDFMSKGIRVKGPIMLQVEKQLKRKGFECSYSSSGLWLIHRPDPSGAYSDRGYFDAVQTIRLATGDSSVVDEAVRSYWNRHLEKSSTGRYLTMSRGGSMATKKADAAEEAAKKQVTVKALDGTEVPVSPKQKEMYDEIVERSASGSPVGSDDERLDDPSSIAAMKLATGEHPVVVRAKFGARWHYFGKQKDADAAVKKAEDAAAEAKKSSKKSAPAGGGEEAPTGSGKKKGGPLKKPSEK